MLDRRLRRLGTGLCAILAFASLVLTAAPAEARRYAAIVIDAESGRTLFARNPDRRIYPASLTKMMTLYLLFEAIETGRLGLDSRLRASKRAAGQPASKLGLRTGESIRVRDAILALTVKSANDVATVVAEALSGSEWRFARSMTAKARELGMSKTTFRNASGLPHREQRSTARDLARLSRALISDFPRFYPLFSQTRFSHGGRTYRTHNKLLGRYPGMDGLKTGYIRASGFNLASSAVRGNRRLIGIVIGGKTAASRNAHMASILDRSFRQTLTLAAAGPDALPKPKPSRGGGAEPAPAVAAAASPPAARGARPVSGWGIQVGAFSRQAPAQLAAAAAQRAAPRLLLRARPRVQPVATERGRLYRAQLVGLSESSARAACIALQSRKIGCVPVPPSSPAQQLAFAPEKPG